MHKINLSLLNKFKKEPNVAFILIYILILFFSYPMNAGFLTDEMAFFNIWSKYDSYLKFQYAISNQIHMVARPVSAIIHGLSFWIFRENLMYYHILNLLIFTIGILLFYYVFSTLFNKSFSFIATLFVVSYPLSSGVLFSSIMINSNFAFLLFIFALFIEIKSKYDYDISVIILIILSLLSYEAYFCFIPFLLMVKIIKNKNEINKKVLINFSVLIFIVFIILLFYRKFFQFLIFDNKTDKLQLLQIKTILLRYIESIYLNITTHTIDFSVLISNSLSKINWYEFIIIPTLIIGLVYYLSKNYQNENSIKIKYISVFIIVAFLSYQLVFACSWSYMPNIHGYDSRILAPYRYLYGLTIAVIINLILQKKNSPIVKLFIIFILSINSFCLIAQKKAWVGANQYSENLTKEISRVIQQNKLYTQDSVTIIIYAPYQFPEQVNKEEILKYGWDFSPSVTRYFANKKINVQVIDKGFVYKSNGIKQCGDLISANYPFYLYKDSSISFVSNEKDILRLLK